MVHAQSFDAISDGFPSRTLPKQTGKPSYGPIQDMHHLLTVNAMLSDIPCGGVQNGHLGLVLMTTKYSLVSRDPFIPPTNPGCTPHIPAWTTPFDEKVLLREHAKQH